MSLISFKEEHLLKMYFLRLAISFFIIMFIKNRQFIFLINSQLLPPRIANGVQIVQQANLTYLEKTVVVRNSLF